MPAILVVLLRPIPAHRGVAEEQSAEHAALHDLLEILHRRVVAILEHDTQLDTVTARGPDHPVGIVQRQGDRFLDDDMLARLHRLDRHLRVEAAGRADVHHVHVLPRQQGVIIGVGSRVILGGKPLRTGLPHVGHGDQTCAGQSAE